MTVNWTAATTAEIMFTKSLSTDMDIEFDIKLLATGYSEGTVRFNAHFVLSDFFFVFSRFADKFLEINQTKINIGIDTRTPTIIIIIKEKGNHAHDD